MNCREIQLALMAERHRRGFVLPNYTPQDWWECDVFELTASGRFREYEIKLSVADFRADRNKTRSQFAGWDKPKLPDLTKHTQLELADERGPTEFYYVVTDEIQNKVRFELPLWAGLISASPREGHRAPYSVSLTTIVKAPRLHKTKANEKIHPHALGVCYYRLHAEMISAGNRVIEEQLKRETVSKLVAR